MRLYVVKVTRLRDRFTQHPAGAVTMEKLEEGLKDLLTALERRSGRALRSSGSRCWRNGSIEVSIITKQAPFRLDWVMEEWDRDKL